jgi:hypothetical protein
MTEIAYPERTTYFVLRTPAGDPFAVELTPEQVLYVGAGASIVWQGEDRAEWARQRTAAGVPESEEKN